MCLHICNMYASLCAALCLYRWQLRNLIVLLCCSLLKEYINPKAREGRACLFISAFVSIIVLEETGFRFFYWHFFKLESVWSGKSFNCDSPQVILDCVKGNPDSPLIFSCFVSINYECCTHSSVSFITLSMEDMSNKVPGLLSFPILKQMNK